MDENIVNDQEFCDVFIEKSHKKKNNVPQLCRQLDLGSNQFKTELENNQHYTIREVANMHN